MFVLAPKMAWLANVSTPTLDLLVALVRAKARSVGAYPTLTVGKTECWTTRRHRTFRQRSRSQADRGCRPAGRRGQLYRRLLAARTRRPSSVPALAASRTRGSSRSTPAGAAMPGVVAVLTGADLVAAGVKPLPVAPMFQRPDGSPGATPLRPALAHGVVRFVGEAVVALVAETPEQAKDALEAVVVEYDDLPVVTGLTAGGRRRRAAGLAGRDRQHRGADEARRRGGMRRRVRRRRPCGLARPGQPASGPGVDGAARARWPVTTRRPDRITLRLSSQMPSGARDTLCEALHSRRQGPRGRRRCRRRVRHEDRLLSRRYRRRATPPADCERPVKWTPARLDEFLSATHGRDIEIARRTRAGCGRQGAGLPHPHAGQHGRLRQHCRASSSS